MSKNEVTDENLVKIELKKLCLHPWGGKVATPADLCGIIGERGL